MIQGVHPMGTRLGLKAVPCLKVAGVYSGLDIHGPEAIWSQGGRRQGSYLQRDQLIRHRVKAWLSDEGRLLNRCRIRRGSGVVHMEVDALPESLLSPTARPPREGKARRALAMEEKKLLAEEVGSVEFQTWSIEARERLLSHEVEQGKPVKVSLFNLEEVLQEVPESHRDRLRSNAATSSQKPSTQLARLERAEALTLFARRPGAPLIVSLREKYLVGTRSQVFWLRQLGERLRVLSNSTVRPIFDKVEASSRAKTWIEDIKAPSIDGNLSQSSTPHLGGLNGYEIRISGRLGGVDRTLFLVLEEGALPLQEKAAAMDHAQGTAVTLQGSLGITVLACYGSVKNEC